MLKNFTVLGSVLEDSILAMLETVESAFSSRLVLLTQFSELVQTFGESLSWALDCAEISFTAVIYPPWGSKTVSVISSAAAFVTSDRLGKKKTNIESEICITKNYLATTRDIVIKKTHRRNTGEIVDEYTCYQLRCMLILKYRVHT